MTGVELFVLGLVVGSVVLFVTEALAVDTIGLLVLVALVLGGVLEPQEALLGFANEALITVGALFVVSEGVVHTGAVAFLSSWIATASRGRMVLMLPLILITVTVSSAFINNTPVVVLFVPIVLGLSHRYGFSPSRLLMPISFASILGGTCTLIGTSTNILINTFATIDGKEQFEPLTMFEFLPLGLVFCGLGLTYLLLFSGRALPDRRTVSSLTAPGKLKEYLTEVRIGARSPSIGQSVSKAILSRQPDLRLLQLIRNETIYWPPLQDLTLEPGDIVMVKGEPDQIAALQRVKGIEMPSFGTAETDELRPQETSLAEIVLTPNSKMVGRTLERVQFRKHHGAAVVAIQRAGTHIREKITDLPLRTGDVLLVQGDETAITGLRGEGDFLLLEGTKPVIDARRAPVAAAILMGVVGTAATGTLDISVAALTGALLMVLSRCITNGRAYRAISWDILMLVACMIALGKGMEHTGLARTLANSIRDLTGSVSPDIRPWVVLSAFYLLVTLLANFISHNAAAVLFIPLALETAAALNVNNRPFLFAVAFAASAAFISPVGYKTHLIVYGPGGYRPGDFFRFGTPLNLLLWVAASALIPVFWPFYP